MITCCKHTLTLQFLFIYFLINMVHTGDNQTFFVEYINTCLSNVREYLALMKFSLWLMFLHVTWLVGAEKLAAETQIKQRDRQQCESLSDRTSSFLLGWSLNKQPALGFRQLAALHFCFPHTNQCSCDFKPNTIR